MTPILNEITIRPIKLTDQDVVVRIYKNGWLETYPNHEYGIDLPAVRKAVENFKSTTIHENKFVAELNGEVVGVISVKEGVPRVIQSLYVARAYQSQGVGTALLRFVFKKFGAGIYTLKVAVYNVGAIDFYQKLGFTIIEQSLEDFSFYKLNIPQITMSKELE